MKKLIMFALLTAIASLSSNAREVNIDDYAYFSPSVQQDITTSKEFIQHIDKTVAAIRKQEGEGVRYFNLATGEELFSDKDIKNTFLNRQGIKPFHIDCSLREFEDVEEGDASIYYRNPNEIPEGIGDSDVSDFRVWGGAILAVDKTYPTNYWYYYITPARGISDGYETKLITDNDCWAVPF